MSFGRGLLGEEADVNTFIVPNYDFSNEEYMSRQLFLQLLERWSNVLKNSH